MAKKNSRGYRVFAPLADEFGQFAESLSERIQGGGKKGEIIGAAMLMMMRTSLRKQDAITQEVKALAENRTVDGEELSDEDVKRILTEARLQGLPPAEKARQQRTVKED